MINVAIEFDALSEVQRTMLDLDLLHEDAFYPALKRLSNGL